MSIPKKIREKYAEQIKMMRQLSMDDDDILEAIDKSEFKAKWTPIKFRDLLGMPQEEMDKLMSYCWHDGKYRCECIGIRDVSIEVCKAGKIDYYILSYSDNMGDPHFSFRDLDEKIDNVGDGEWNYGLYKEKKKK